MTNKYRKAMKGKGGDTIKKIARKKLKGTQEKQWNDIKHALKEIKKKREKLKS